MPDFPQELEDQVRRLMDASGVTSYAALERLLEVGKGSVYSAKTRGKLPDRWFIQISREYGKTLDWLIKGIPPVKSGPGPAAPDAEPETGTAAFGEKPSPTVGRKHSSTSWEAPVFVSTTDTDNPWKNTKWQDVPVIGLANCGKNDWYSQGASGLRMSLPVDYPYRPELFGLLAVGSSMQPDGIRQGYVLFCDPTVGLDPGDAVYVERKNGLASVKRFLKKENQKLHLQGWHAPDANGHQEPYFEEIPLEDIKRIACVVITKRKTS